MKQNTNIKKDTGFGNFTAGVFKGNQLPGIYLRYKKAVAIFKNLFCLIPKNFILDHKRLMDSIIQCTEKTSRSKIDEPYKNIDELQPGYIIEAFIENRPLQIKYKRNGSDKMSRQANAAFAFEIVLQMFGLKFAQLDYDSKHRLLGLVLDREFDVRCLPLLLKIEKRKQHFKSSLKKV
jgi:hypothetical protein